MRARVCVRAREFVCEACGRLTHGDHFLSSVSPSPRPSPPTRSSWFNALACLSRGQTCVHPGFISKLSKEFRKTETIFDSLRKKCLLPQSPPFKYVTQNRWRVMPSVLNLTLSNSSSSGNSSVGFECSTGSETSTIFSKLIEFRAGAIFSWKMNVEFLSRCQLHTPKTYNRHVCVYNTSSDVFELPMTCRSTSFKLPPPKKKKICGSPTLLTHYTRWWSILCTTMFDPMSIMCVDDELFL